MRKNISERKLSLQKNFIFNFIYQILTLLLPLITTPYISRVLGADKIGIYSYSYAIISTFMMVGSLGIATYGQKEIASNRDKPQMVNFLFWEIFLLKIITMGISSIGLIIYALYDRSYCIYYFVQMPFVISAVLDISWIFQGLERFDVIVIRNTFVKILGIILIFLLVRQKDDLIIYLLILGGSQLLGNLTAWAYASTTISKPAIRGNYLKYHLKQTLVYFVPTIAYQVYAVLDRVMLGAISNSNYQNGFYEQAHKIVGIVTSIYTAYNIVLRSRMSYYFSQNRIDAIKQQFQDSLLVITFFSTSVSMGLFAITTGFVPWFFGEGFNEVSNILYIFCPMIFIMGFSMCIGTHLLTPGGLQKQANIAQCIAAVLNLLFNFLLIPKFEAKGAAFASFISQLSVAIFYIPYAHKYINYREWIPSLIKNVFAGFMMIIVISYIKRILSVGLISTAIEILIGALSYLLILAIFKDKFFKTILNHTKNILLKR